MEFEMYVKDKNEYKLLKIIPPSGSGWDYFKSLKLTVEEQLDNIRNDICKVFNKPKEEINLIFPKINDSKKQEKIDKLVEIRNTNNNIKVHLNKILMDDEFILCEDCGGKMYKTPLNVRYTKFGSKFIIDERDTKFKIKYVYLCSNCTCAISEEIYSIIQNTLKIRNELLERGESFVPNKYNFWHWVNDNKITKPSELQNPELPSKRRLFESIKVKGVKNPFVKITEEEVHI